jgi:hypothetical protein
MPTHGTLKVNATNQKGYSHTHTSSTSLTVQKTVGFLILLLCAVRIWRCIYSFFGIHIIQPLCIKGDTMNYKDTFILTADDCPAEEGVVPTIKEGKTKPIHA